MIKSEQDKYEYLDRFTGQYDNELTRLEQKLYLMNIG